MRARACVPCTSTCGANQLIAFEAPCLDARCYVRVFPLIMFPRGKKRTTWFGGMADQKGAGAFRPLPKKNVLLKVFCPLDHDLKHPSSYRRASPLLTPTRVTSGIRFVSSYNDKNTGVDTSSWRGESERIGGCSPSRRFRNGLCFVSKSRGQDLLHRNDSIRTLQMQYLPSSPTLSRSRRRGFNGSPQVPLLRVHLVCGKRNENKARVRGAGGGGVGGGAAAAHLFLGLGKCRWC